MNLGYIRDAYRYITNRKSSIEKEDEQYNMKASLQSDNTGIYDHYPGDRAQYPMGVPDQFNFPKIDFQAYEYNHTIIDSKAKDTNADIFATSGSLLCKEVDGVKDGFTSTYNFRMLCNPKDPNTLKRVRYTDFETLFIGKVNKWHSNAPNWAGLHIFARYQTENDLYVASFRKDGKVTIKKKIKGNYTTLKYATYGDVKLGEEYFFQFQVNGPTLTYKINGEVVLEVNDKDLQWGTTGIRTDYSDSNIDYIRVGDV
jgi:hypothetical protein